MVDERIYHQYANWKLEHNDTLSFLKEKDSSIYFRFEHVLDVADYFYDKLIDDKNYTEDEDAIFQSAFLYLENQLAEINKILNDYYRNDLASFHKDEKSINLVLNAIEFQNELLRLENFEATDMQYFLDFEQDILNKIQNKEQIEENSFTALDEASSKIFKKLEIDYYPMSHIFLDIASELGIV